MKKTVYNKLVRDNIPSIIESQGKKCTWYFAHEEDRLKLLKEKLVEEVNELVNAEDLIDVTEELADILTIINSIADRDPRIPSWVNRRMILKQDSKGGFNNLIVLESVEEEEEDVC